MTSIKNDRPTGGARTTSTTEAKGPPPTEQSKVDDLDGVTDLEKLEGHSLQNGTSFEPAKRMSPSMRASIDLALKVPMPPSARIDDVAALTAMVSKAALELKPGESLVLGGKVDGALGGAVGIEAEIGIKRLEDGRYEVKVDRGMSGGLGAQEGFGNAKAGIKAAVVIGTGSKHVVDSYEAAGLIAAEAAVMVAAGGTPFGPIANIVFDGVNANALQEVHAEIGLELEGQLQVFAGLRDQLVGGGTAGIVRTSTGAVFLEIKGALESDQAKQAGAASGEVTLRVPLGQLPDGLLDDASTQKRLLDVAKAQPPGATISFEGELDVGSILGGVTTSLEKEINGYRLDELFAQGGWTARTGVKIGPDLDGGIGPFTGEVSFQKTVIYHEAKASTPAAAFADVKAHKSEIAAQLK